MERKPAHPTLYRQEETPHAQNPGAGGRGGDTKQVCCRGGGQGEGREPAVKSYHRQEQNAATTGEGEGTLHPSPSRTRGYMPPRELDGSLRFGHTGPKKRMEQKR